MAFLPIAERELRLAARRKSTHRVRVWTTLAGLAVSFFFIVVSMLMQRITGGGVGRNLGPFLFKLLTYYAFGLSLLAGVVLAADCISVEKREGTLGLLFLTDLKGYDVVFGKVVAVGINALFGLVAVLPVTGLPLLMGGVTGAEFWRVGLALVNTLFFALATGILVSTCSREANAAMLTTLAVLGIVAIALPMAGAVLSFIRLPNGWWYFTSFSPANAFSYGLEARYWSAPGRYWYSLLASHLVAWTMLILASCLLPRVWQDKPFRRRNYNFAAVNSGGAMGGAAAANARRSRLLDLNPILWLSENNPGMFRWAWTVTVGGVAITALVLLLNQSVWTYSATSGIFFVLACALKIMVAFQACKFFVDARRTGALEMIFSTPLTEEEIIRGQWLALKRLFLWPAIVLFSLQLALSLLTVDASTRFVGFKMTTVPNIGAQNVANFMAMKWPILLFSAASLLYKTAKSVCDIFAVGWMGMWFGFSSKKPSLAVGMTILFVLVIPGFVFCVPDPVIDLIFCLWARNKLRHELRRTARSQGLVPLYGPGSMPVMGHPPVIR